MQMQRNYDKAFGFNTFPYTHGDDVERAQEDATKKWREELVEELEKRKADRVAKRGTSSSQQIELAEGELREKARTMVEAKENEKAFFTNSSSKPLKKEMFKNAICQSKKQIIPSFFN